MNTKKKTHSLNERVKIAREKLSQNHIGFSFLQTLALCSTASVRILKNTTIVRIYRHSPYVFNTKYIVLVFTLILIDIIRITSHCLYVHLRSPYTSIHRGIHTHRLWVTFMWCVTYAKITQHFGIVRM